MDFSTLGMSEQIVIDVQPGEITKLRIDYEGELKQGNTVRLLISAVDDSGNFVSYCNANSAIVTSEIGKVIREDSQLYMKFEGSGSSTIEVGCYGFKETFYLQIEETILWGIFEDTQKVIIYTSLILMIIITVLLVLMITRSKDEYEEYDDVQPLPLAPISTQPIIPIQHTMPPLPALPLPLPPMPQIPKIPAPQIPVQTPVQTQQNINPPQLQIQVESSEQKLGNAMNLLTNKESVSEDVETNKAKFEPLSDDDLSWD